MKYINGKRVEKILWGPADAPFSMRKQLNRIIVFCCALTVCVQVVLMTTFMIRQYVNQEKIDLLDTIESDNYDLDNAFQYVEGLATSIRYHTGLKVFFEGENYDAETVRTVLKTTTNLLGSGNHLKTNEIFVEKIYLFNFEGEVISNLYYPLTRLELENELEKYEKLYKSFLNDHEKFYYQVDEKHINLCMYIYDEKLEPQGIAIFALNKSYINSIYENLDKFEHYRWYLAQGEQKILEKEKGNLFGDGRILEHRLSTGFELEIYAGVPLWVVYQLLGKLIGIILLFAMILAAFLSFAGYKVSMFYVKSLEKISENIKLVGSGNFNTKLPSYPVEELKNISSTFNEMTDYINHLTKEVYETRLMAQQIQIQYLQAQTNPHFLYNVLTMIETRAAINQDREVQQMIHQLSGLYQGKIFRKDECFICLKEELEIVEFYLSLQEKRFGEKITYSIVYENENGLYENLMVPRLSIEPIVENAVYHGLQPKVENGHIKIKLLIQDELLKVYIEDDGVGFDSDSAMKKQEDRSRTHTGLWNTNKMIHTLCGEEYGLQIESERGIGTKVCVVLPVRYGESYVESNDCG